MNAVVSPQSIAVAERLSQRSEELCARAMNDRHRSADRMFLWLLSAQWVFGIVLALSLSPYSWDGTDREVHPHVYAALLLGFAINAFPITLIFTRPGAPLTRYSIAVAQMLWSALFIHLTHGRIETHFHVFGSLAFLAFYKDRRVLIIATVTVAADHYLRGLLWPESVYGTLNPEWWRFLEHAGWVLFEVFVLVVSCDRTMKLNRALAEREARLELTNEDVERQVAERTEQLRAQIAVREAREEDLRRAQIAAEAANRAKSQFLANMSHEIRTPMNGVLGFTNLLLDTPLSAEQREHVQTIRGSGEALLQIINDILDFSKVEAGKLTVERVPFDLRQAVEEVIDLLAAQAEQKQLELALRVDPELPGHLEGDPGRVRQVLLNLIGNAIKFTREGYVRVEVAVVRPDPSSSRCEVCCAVTDTGIGIEREKHEMLFQEFSQADNSTTREFGGTGLGLAISHRLSTLMGGRIDFTSEPGKGSCFRFTLPMKPVVRPVQLLEAPQRFSGTERTVAADFPGAASPAHLELESLQPRVLVAEDNAVNQRLVKRMLEKLGYRVDIAGDGREAVKMATEFAYSLVFMDCSMPEMDGFQATAELRRRALGKGRLPIVALTANARAEDRELCLAAGMDDYLSKPVRIEEIQLILERWVPRLAATSVASGRA